MRRVASINIDIDTLSEDLDDRTQTLSSAELRRITYTKVMPRFLDLLKRHQIKATFFIIGKDVAQNKELLKRIAKEGHELANHTMTHPKQLVNLTAKQIEKEILDCGEALRSVTGKYPVGFRAPGYTISPVVLDILRKHGYRYDSSLNGSISYYAIKKSFKALRLKDKAYLTTQRFSDLFSSRAPYRIAVNSVSKKDPNSTLIEMPISVIPYISYPFVSALLLPFHQKFSHIGLSLIRRNTTYLNFELHINEFTKAEDVAGRADTFYLTRNWIQIDYEKRIAYFDALFSAIKKEYDIQLLRDIQP
jgi:peptidoglycan-N-acetylglucosamine deacetylase